MVAYYFSFKTALVKGSPNVVAPNATVLIYDVTDVNRVTPVTAYSDAGLTTITNLVSDAHGIVPDFYTNNRPDVLWKSGTFKGQWATSQSRPGLQGPVGPEGPQGIQGAQGNPGLNGAGTNADVATYVTNTGATRDALDGRYLKTTTAASTYTTTAQANTAADNRIAAARGAAGGIASLDGTGKVPSAQIPYASVNQYGTYAARPTAAAAGSGATYYASDVSETYRSNGTAWQVVGTGGSELGYAEIATNFDTTSTTKVDVTGLTVTFKAGERPIEAKVGALVQAASAGGRPTLHILLDGVVVAEVPNRIDPTANGYMVFERSRRLPAMTPGSTHTVKIQASSSGGNMTVFGVPSNPAGLSVVNR